MVSMSWGHWLDASSRPWIGTERPPRRRVSHSAKVSTGHEALHGRELHHSRGRHRGGTGPCAKLEPAQNLGTHVAQTLTPERHTEDADGPSAKRGHRARTQRFRRSQLVSHRPGSGDFQPDPERRYRLTEASSQQGTANGLRSAFPLIRARFASYPRPDSNRRYRLERAGRTE